MLADIEVDRIADEGTPSKAAHALRYLRLVMQWGRNRGYLDSNPAMGIEAPVERKQRRLPSLEVMQRLIDRARELLGMPTPEADDTQTAEDKEPPVLVQPCPHCGGAMIVIETFEPGHLPRAPPPRKADRP